MKLCIVAGEASGDHHAANVVRALRGSGVDLELFGLGGDKLREEGMDTLAHVRELAIVGLFNVIRHIPRYRRVMRTLLTEIERRRPDAVMFVDFPDFNLHTARSLVGRGIPLLYYISPQVWAWRRGRIRKIARIIDHMMVIFPFEEELYSEHMKVTFVGHPILDRLAPHVPAGARKKPTGPIRLAVLPGSRTMEIESLLPVMMRSLAELSAETELDPVLIRAETIDAGQLERAVPGLADQIEIVEDDGGATLASCDLAIASSGTVTLEAAVLGVPMVVLYRLPRLTYALARLLVDLEHYSLVNIVARKEVVPELIQKEANAERLATEIRRLLDPEVYERVANDLVDVRSALGAGGAAERVAAIIRAEAES